MKNYLTLFLFFVLTINGFSQWRTSTIASFTEGNAFDVLVGDGRNNGNNSVFVSTKAGAVYESIFDNVTETWSTQTILGGLTNAKLIFMALGACKNDGVNRLYFSEMDHSGGRIFEATWGGSNWNTIQIGTASEAITEIIIGDGRNDGLNRLYIGGTGTTGFNEYTWDGTNWTSIQLYVEDMEGSGFVGDATGSGMNSVYSTGQYIKKCDWNGTAYNSNDISISSSWPDPFSLGDCRNDGVQRIYANTNDGRHEITYNTSTTNWDVVTISNNAQRGDICLAKLKADGLSAIYSTFSSITWSSTPALAFTEYKWNGTDYDSTMVLDATSGATSMINAGIGRNDDTMRLYAPNYGANSLFEITWANPYYITPDLITKVKTDNFEFTAYSQQKSVHINLAKIPDEITSVEMYSVDGRFIFTKQLFDKNNQVYINGVNQGVYVLKVKSGNKFHTKKIFIND